MSSFVFDPLLKQNAFLSPFFYYKAIPLFRDRGGWGIGLSQKSLYFNQWLSDLEEDYLTFKVKDECIESYFKNFPIPTFVFDRLILKALESEVSDIHFFQRKEEVEVKFRSKQGVSQVDFLSISQYMMIKNLIQFESKLDQSISNEPQQGSFSVPYLSKNLFIRTSILPTMYGQDIVLRLTLKNNRFKNLFQLGFCNEKTSVFQKMLHEKSGIILVTGSTGSGKTTTLYALVNELLKNENLVCVSLEDPIECEVKGLRQSQVNLNSRYTYAMGLKALLRQDPDVILVGEIRDLETAAIAFQAAYTGHLVLSSCHTKDVFSTLARLSQLQVDPAYIEGALKGVIAQKLLPKNNTLYLESEILYTEKGISNKALRSMEVLVKENIYLA